MGEYERQQAVYRELQDGDFGSKRRQIRISDGQMSRLMRVYGIAAVAVFGALGTLAVLSITSLA